MDYFATRDGSNSASLRSANEVAAEYAVSLARIHRKVNAGPAAERAWRKRELARSECVRRGVRFLPFQCLRPLFVEEGLL